MKRGVWIIALLLWTGCASAAPTQWVTYPSGKGEKGVGLEEWLKEHPLKDDQAVSIEEISRGETASAAIVQIRKQDPLHVHQSHDMTFILLKGEGILWIGDRKLQLKPGSIVTIPRSFPYSFTNQSSEPAVAYAMFNPAFDGKDSIPVAVTPQENPQAHAGKK